MPSLQELLERKAALERQIVDAQKESRVAAIAQVRALMNEYGLTAADLAAPAQKRSASAGPRAKVAAKYRHPGTGATWSGRGLKPKWLAEELANGKRVADFAI